MKTDNPLAEIHPWTIGPDGMTIEGYVEMKFFNMPNTDRTSCRDDLFFNLSLFLVSQGLLVQGKLYTVFRCRCDRCLCYYNHTADIKDLCHYYKVTGEDVVDLTEDIREDILLDFPQQLLCRTECEGLCLTCGQNLNVRTCNCVTESQRGNHVWDILDEIKTER